MSDKPRGGNKGPRGGGDGRGGGRGGGGGGRGGGGGGRGGGQSHQGGGGPPGKKESILDLAKHMNHKIRVKFAGGREVVGVLKGFDPLMNLVIDDTEEYLYTIDGYMRKDAGRRNLGLVVCRGTTLILISPFDGYEEIANPFE
ncbi:Sm-like protein lsm7 [Dinochytrium kinnereticum]|nr:Sm-like protein lsm7 [Dinochytrium kinnereticum]